MPNLDGIYQRAFPHLPQSSRQTIETRLHAQAPLLQDRLARLYGGRAGFQTWLLRLLADLGSIHAARPQALLRLDRAREGDPDWFTRSEMLGYCTYVDRFAGTLEGVAKRVGHLRELGVTYLHLLPFLKSRSGDNDGGFAVSSYEEVEPRLGHMDDLERLADTLRQSGISLCADLVLNHVADDHAWARSAREGDAGFRDFFYVYPDRTVPDRLERTLAQIFPQAAPGNFTWCEKMGGWVWTTFYPFQWDLNYTNPEVFSEMARTLLRLANRGVEIFRLDSTAFLWKREGTNGMNQPEAHWILQALRALVDIFAPGVLLKAEAIVPTAALRPYLNGLDDDPAQARECHLAYHSSLMASSWVALARQDTSLIREVVKETPNLDRPASWISYVRCHDDIGWSVLRQELAALGQDDRILAETAAYLEGKTPGSFASGVAFQTGGEVSVHGTNGMTASLVGLDTAVLPDECELACRRLVLMYSVAFCFGAIPLIYMGDEIGQANDSPENWKQAGNLGGKYDSRWVQRPHLAEKSFASRHDGATLPGKVFSRLTRLARLRKERPELASNRTRELIETSDLSLLVLKRGETFWLVANFSDEPKLVPRWQFGIAANDTVVDLLAEESIGKDVALTGWQARWLSCGAKGI